MKTNMIDYCIKEYSSVGAVVSLQEFEPKKVVEELGGTSKIAKVVKDIDKEPLYEGRHNKIKYAISNYSKKSIESLKEYLKNRLKEEGFKATYKQSKRQAPYLMPSEVVSYGLLEDGFELLLYDKLLAKTVAAFDPFEYEKRDKERPCQRPLQMISIRLAKILLNLAGAKERCWLLDPFCGYGILLQEALLRGMNVIGIDIDKACTEATLKNLEWVVKKYNAQGSYKVITADSTQLSRFVRHADCVATEPYMGPLLNKLPTKEEAHKTVRQLGQMYAALLRELKKVVSGKIAIVLPRFRLYSGERIKIDFERMLKENDFEAVSVFPEIKMPVVYTAPGSKIEREIWVIVRKH